VGGVGAGLVGEAGALTVKDPTDMQLFDLERSRTV
jgi:hypothetical protein